MAVRPSDISGNDWCGPLKSTPAADRMSGKYFGANPVFSGRNLRFGPAKNEHVQSFSWEILSKQSKYSLDILNF